MNRIIRFAVLFLGAALLLASCQKAPFLTMTGPRSYNFNRDGGTQSFAFSCNRDWNVNSSESWIRVSPSSGAAGEGDITVTITCSPNTTYDVRTATITVKAEELTETISVSQDTGLGLILSPTTFDLTNAEQDIEIEVQKNVQYAIAIDDAGIGWIKQGGTKALTTDKVVFKISANTTYDNREGHITFKQTDGDLTGTVIVRQSQTDGMIISTTNYTLSNDPQTLNVDVNANVSFEVTSEAAWIKYVETKALTKSSITLDIEGNTGNSYRTGKVNVKQTNGDLVGSITVKQLPTPTVSALDAVNIGLHRATLKGTISMEDASQLIQKVGFLYSMTETTLEGLQNNGASLDTSLEADLSFMKKLTALEMNSQFHYVAYALMDNKYYYSNIQVFTTPALPAREVPEGAVELGLTVLWGNTNIGANAPEDYGNYYKWGETSPATSPYLPKNTKYYDESTDSYTKYNDSDGMLVLDATDDVAQVVLGGGWRMPTEEDCVELIDNCTWTNTTFNGVNGYLVTSVVNGNSIFLPAAGCLHAYTPFHRGEDINYWSSSVYSSDCRGAAQISFNTQLNRISVVYNGRFVGCSVRPVIE